MIYKPDLYNLQNRKNSGKSNSKFPTGDLSKYKSTK